VQKKNKRREAAFVFLARLMSKQSAQADERALKAQVCEFKI
jgi:hypothetical protein